MSFISKLFGRTPEKRSESVTPSYFSDGLLFGTMNTSNTAMNLSAVYRAVELISDAVATLPIQVKEEKGGFRGVVPHSLDKIFLEHYTLVKLLIQSVLLKGNGYAYIERNPAYKSVEGLRFLKASDVTVSYNENTNEVSYTCRLVNGGRQIPALDMIHLFKNSFDGVTGVSVLKFADRTIKTATDTENSAKSFYENGCNLAGVLTVQGSLTDQQKNDIRTSWGRAYSNGGAGLAVLQGNMTYQPIQVSASDAQMLESRLYNVSDIARFFGVSPVLLGDLSKSSYSTIEAVQLDFLTHTLQPYIVMVEDELNRKLLPTLKDKSEYRINLDDNFVLKSDKAAQANYYSTLLQNGVMSVNEVRRELGLSAISGGDSYNLMFVDTEKTKLADENTRNQKSDGTNT